MVQAGLPTTGRYAKAEDTAEMTPMMIGLSPATEATLRTIGHSTATAAPFDMVLVTAVVSAETATQSPKP